MTQQRIQQSEQQVAEYLETARTATVVLSWQDGGYWVGLSCDGAARGGRKYETIQKAVTGILRRLVKMGAKIDNLPTQFRAAREETIPQSWIDAI
jgi:hypothetical protein